MEQTRHRVNLQAAFILHGRDFQNTSRLLDVFTKDFGRITLVAKGARSARSKMQGILQPFTSLIISWTGKGDVQTLTGAETVKSSINLSGKQVMSGYYVNELIQRLVTFHDPHSDLFSVYQTTLENLSTGNDDELILRCFEKNMLAEIGYGLCLDTESISGTKINKDLMYHYDVENGPIVESAEFVSDDILIKGQTLLDLFFEKFTSPQSKKEAKRLMRVILNHHLGDKPLKTRNLHWYKPL